MISASSSVSLPLKVRSRVVPRSRFFNLQMYMAPELMFGMPYGLAVDMWAIGVVTFELLHSMHPFW